MTKYIDAEKLKKAIEDKGLNCSFALKMERLDTLALIDELQQEDIPETALCATCPNRRNTHAYQDGYDAGRADALKEMKNR